ncbi:MAG: hypothetical protein HZA35_01710 [Parcubacteria group bacterium]|nr:hypothetical protein [Parcubacteria group bacterium]
MYALRDVKLERGKITEHRSDGNVIGVVQYAGVNGDGSLGVGWYTGSNRTTCFSPDSWEFEINGDVIVLTRIGFDVGTCDLPYYGSNKYTIVLGK